MQIVKKHEYRTVPWKNGGGTTVELYVSPAGSVEFDWRVSIASIAASGPFSTFSGYDRCIVLLQGQGMSLDIEGTGNMPLRALKPFSFSGDAKVTGVLQDGPVSDFNLIVRRSFATGQIEVLQKREHLDLPVGNAIKYVYLIDGSAKFGQETVQSGESIVLDHQEGLSLRGYFDAIVCTVKPVSPPL
jgi:uncharacterized protein